MQYPVHWSISVVSYRDRNRARATHFLRMTLFASFLSHQIIHLFITPFAPLPVYGFYWKYCCSVYIKQAKQLNLVMERISLVSLWQEISWAIQTSITTNCQVHPHESIPRRQSHRSPSDTQHHLLPCQSDQVLVTEREDSC